MQLIIIYTISAMSVWLLIGMATISLFIINRPKRVILIKPVRLWIVGTLLWPYLIVLMFSRR